MLPGMKVKRWRCLLTVGKQCFCGHAAGLWTLHAAAFTRKERHVHVLSSASRAFSRCLQCLEWKTSCSPASLLYSVPAWEIDWTHDHAVEATDDVEDCSRDLYTQEDPHCLQRFLHIPPSSASRGDSTSPPNHGTAPPNAPPSSLSVPESAPSWSGQVCCLLDTL